MRQDSNFKMSSCAGITAKKAPCKKPGKILVDGKLYCSLHAPRKEGDKEGAPAAVSSATSKAKSASSKTKADEPMDEFEIYEQLTAAQSAAADVFDISENRNNWILPRNIRPVSLFGYDFMSAEHAFHCLKFFYPAPSNTADGVLVAFKEVYSSTSLDEIRELASKNGPHAKFILPKWEKEINGVPHCELVMMTILDSACKNSPSLRDKITSITREFEDSDRLATAYVPGYCRVLRALANHLRNS